MTSNGSLPIFASIRKFEQINFYSPEIIKKTFAFDFKGNNN